MEVRQEATECSLGLDACISRCLNQNSCLILIYNKIIIGNEYEKVIDISWLSAFTFFMLLTLSSCLEAGLDELESYNDAEIRGFKFEHRWEQTINGEITLNWVWFHYLLM